MNKFIAQMGNDAVIRVYFFDTEGQIDVEGNVPYDLSKAQDIVVELVNQFRKRTKMAYKIEAPNVLLIELPVELQKIGNYFLEVLFQVPNEALADGLQAYRLRLDGVSIVEAGAVSGQVGATFGVIDPNTPTRAALLAQIETLTTERDTAKEAQAQAEEDKATADEAKAQAETKLAEVERSIQGARNFFMKKGDISNDIATEVRTEEFIRSSIDGQVSLPNVTMVGARAFSGLYLTRVDLPKATVIKQEAFRECNNLSYINIPMATTVELGAFENVYGYAKMYVSESVFEAFSRRSNEENLKFFSPHPWGSDGDFTVEVISATTGRIVHIYRTVNNGYGGY